MIWESEKVLYDSLDEEVIMAKKILVTKEFHQKALKAIDKMAIVNDEDLKTNLFMLKAFESFLKYELPKDQQEAFVKYCEHKIEVLRNEEGEPYDIRRKD